MVERRKVRRAKLFYLRTKPLKMSRFGKATGFGAPAPTFEKAAPAAGSAKKAATEGKK